MHAPGMGRGSGHQMWQRDVAAMSQDRGVPSSRKRKKRHSGLGAEENKNRRTLQVRRKTPTTGIKRKRGEPWGARKTPKNGKRTKASGEVAVGEVVGGSEVDNMVVDPKQ
jgi:hypothetical protein